jgi:hypothetical protein
MLKPKVSLKKGFSLYMEKIVQEKIEKESNKDQVPFKKEVGSNVPIRRTVLLTKEIDDA